MVVNLPFENKDNLLCEHGCGQIAKYRNLSGKLCCSETFYQCPGYKKRQSDDSRNRPPSIPKGTYLKDKSGICQICGKPHNGRYGSGRYCSSECAHKASVQNSNQKLIHQKTSEKLRMRSELEIYQASLKNILTYNKNHPDSKKQLPVLHKSTINKQGNRVRVTKCKICGQYGCPEPQQCTHMKHLKLNKFSNVMDLSKLGTIDIYKEYQKLKDYIYDCYINKHMSSPDIAKIFDINWVSVMFLLKKFKIDKRNKSESAIYTMINHPDCKTFNGYTGYHCGYHTSWEGKTFWYRSSYELDYAKELDEKKIRYEVESIRMIYWSSILDRQKLMVCDFYLPDTNTVVEVKSDFTYIEKDWKDRIAVLVAAGYTPSLLLEHQFYDINHIPVQKSEVNISNIYNN